MIGLTRPIFGVPKNERVMDKSRVKKVLTAVQIVLAILVVVGVAWSAFKLIGYNQAQHVYQEIESAYASQPVDGDPSSVNFEKLQMDFTGIKGWLKMDDVDVSYPIVQGEDNEYYLHYDPHGNENIDGSIFMDYRNKSFNDLHVLIYGHNMLDQSMFGLLPNYTSEEFYRNGTGAFTIFTPEGSYRYQIFAVDIVDPMDDVYQVGYQNPAVFDGFVKQLKANSMYDTGVEVSGSDHVVTLSTCSDDDRLVLSAKRL